MSGNRCEISNSSPLLKIRNIVVAPPGPEVVFGLSMPPEISLFEATSCESCSAIQARLDHERMQQAFAAHHMNVINMRRVVGEALANKPFPFKNQAKLLREMENRLKMLNGHYGLRSLETSMQELEWLLRRDVEQMGEAPAIAINSVLTNCANLDGSRQPFRLEKPPAANFIFQRDQAHVVGSEMVTHHMHYPIRQQEVRLVEIGLRAMGWDFRRLPLVVNKHRPQSIEGGDILPYEVNGRRYAMIGRAERTTDAAVDAWYDMHERIWRRDGIIPAVVEGPRSDTQDQMHLDTYNQQVGPGTILHCREITYNRTMKILWKRNGEIKRLDAQPFSQWIEENFPHVYNMTRREQLMYAPNVVVDGGRTVFTTCDGTPNVTSFLRQHIPEVVELKMNHLRELYGGAHCGSQEIREN